MSPRIAVAVVSWNTRDLLAACLRSLAEDDERGLAEVWVVDNGSRDGSRELVRRRFPWASLVEPGENLGFGRAVNVVAERTASDWIAAANADVELLPGALEALLATGEADPKVAAVAPRLLLPDGSTQHSVHPFPTVPLALLFNLGLARLSRRLGDRLCLERSWDPERARAVPWALGALLLLRRSAFEQVGGFPEGHWMYAEDLDLGWRLARAGWSTRYEPGARVRHAESAAAAQAFGDERTRRLMAASYAWMLRRRGLARTWTIALLNWVGATARAAALTPVSPFAARSRQARDEARAWMGAHRTGLRTPSHIRSHR
jgi:GT2 family glycosyltransferase